MSGDTAWFAKANCLGLNPDLFYPERGAVPHQARAICDRCVVRDDCLEWALERPETLGVWGGKSDRQRRQIRATRRREETAA